MPAKLLVILDPVRRVPKPPMCPATAGPKKKSNSAASVIGDARKLATGNSTATCTVAKVFVIVRPTAGLVLLKKIAHVLVGRKNMRSHVNNRRHPLVGTPAVNFWTARLTFVI